MYFLDTTDNNHYIRIFNQIVTDGMFRGIMTYPHIACSNPALNPSLKLMRYIFHLEQITTLANDLNNNNTNVIINNLPLLKINWLGSQNIFGTRPPQINKHLRQLKQIDIDILISTVNAFENANPFSEEEIQSNTYLQTYFFEDDFDYNTQLRKYKWHEKRFDFFSRAEYRCTSCNANATIKMISEVGEGDNSCLSYSYDRFLGQNQNKINSAIACLNSFTLPLIKLNWAFLPHPNVAEEVILQLHHRYYINDGRKAWEYEDDCFQVLCRNCHAHIHETKDIPVFDSEEDKNNMLPNLFLRPEICGRCEGLGYIEAFRHVQNGICFQCWGEGFSFQNSV